MAKITRGRFGRKKLFSQQPLLGEPDYRPSEFFIPSHDAQGHGVKVVGMITPEMKREIQTVLARKTVPLWSTEGDLIRWCIAIGLETLSRRTKDPEVQSAHAMSTSWIEMQRVLYDGEYWRTTLRAMRMQIVTYVKEGHYIPAAKILRLAEAMVDQIGDEYWRKRFETGLLETNQWLKAKAKQQERKMKRGSEQEEEEEK